MKLDEIRQRAATAGIRWRGLRKAELIRAIQRGESNPVCFGTSRRERCGELACCWRKDCLSEPEAEG
ncbi:MAG: SAP domain-containing protein [Pseudomonadota bacterium]|jgi:hypothetical protein